jgi:hypothetical protein
MMKIPALLLPLFLLVPSALPAAAQAPAPGSAAATAAPAAEEHRRVVIDSRELRDTLSLQHRVLSDPEFEETKKISQHAGSVQQLMLWSKAYTGHGGPVLFHPGIAVPLETRKQREARKKAASGSSETAPKPGPKREGSASRE